MSLYIGKKPIERNKKMIFKIIASTWPVLIPVAIYLFWLLKETRKKDIKVKDDFIEKKRRYMFYALIACAVIVVIMLIIYGVYSPEGNLSDKSVIK